MTRERRDEIRQQVEKDLEEYGDGFEHIGDRLELLDEVSRLTALLDEKAEG